MYLKNWIKSICQFEKPDFKIKCFYFGLFESSNGYTIYLIGSEKTQLKVEDWEVDQCYSPKQKYFELQINGKWEQVLEIIISELEEFTQSNLFKYSFFAKAESIFTGFDDGDIIKIH